MNAFQKLMLISCAVIFILAYFHVVLWWDEAVYVNNAYSIIGVTENWRFVAWERQPGISILEAIAISGFGEIGFAVVAFAGALGLVVLAYLLAKENGGSDTQAVFAGMIMLFSPAFWASGYTFASDAWGAVTSLAAFLFYLRYMRTERATEFYLALLLAGISFWFRDLCIITGGCIILWEFLFNKKAGYKILPGLGIYSLILGIYFIDTTVNMGTPFARMTSHVGLILNGIGYGISDPIWRTLTWLIFITLCYGLMLKALLTNKNNHFLIFIFAINTLAAISLNLDARYMLISTGLLAALYACTIQSEKRVSWVALLVPAIFAIAVFAYIDFLGPGNIDSMKAACLLAKNTTGDIYASFDAPFLSQCSQRPVWSMDLGCDGGRVLSFNETNGFSPYIQKCAEYLALVARIN